MTKTPTTWELFVAFFIVAISGFGGTLPFARRMLVDRRQWLTPEDFTETLSLCQTLPGPNIVNMSIVIGSRMRGWRGSIAGFLGLVGAPVIIVTTLGALYSLWGNLPQVRAALVGLGAAASGLVIATAARMAEPLLRNRPRAAAPFMLTGFAAVALLRLPLPYVLLTLAPISIGLSWWLRSRERARV
ncbi:MAG TPA: chromate transporter [Caulobacteraceae bacterium]